MSEIVAFPDKNEKPREIPLDVPMLGIPHYPSYAGEDFSKAYKRFFLASGAVKSSDPAYTLTARYDNTRYRHIFECYSNTSDDLMITFEEVQAFVLLVTGHPRQWYAAWQYDTIIENVMTSEDVDAREAQEAINDAYAAAVSIATNGR